MAYDEETMCHYPGSYLFKVKAEANRRKELGTAYRGIDGRVGQPPTLVSFTPVGDLATRVMVHRYVKLSTG